MTASGLVDQWPAAIAQERHWAYQRRFPEAAGFNIPVATMIRGPLDVGALDEAIRRVAERHEALRATFRAGPRRLYQVLRPAGELPIEVHDLRHLPRGERLARLRDVGATEAARPFALSAEPVLRAHLVRLEHDEAVLVLNVHHISYDGWSSPVFFAELDDQYAAIVRKGTPQRPVPAHRYVDYASWQRRQLAADAYADQLRYWQDLLRHPAPPVDWPTDEVDGQAPWWAGDMVWLSFPQSLVQDAQRVARACGATLFVVLLATYQLALQRLLDTPRFAVGTPVAGRTAQRWEDVIGFFVNTIVMPYEHDAALTFQDLVGRVQKLALAAQQNQDLPYGVLLDRLEPPTPQGRTPFFQTLFLLQNYPSPQRRLDSREVQSRKLVTGSARYDITFSLDRLGDELTLELENRTGVVSQATAVALAREFFAVLAAAVASPGTPVGDLVPVPVPVTVHRRPGAEAELDDLFAGLVADWRQPR
ncbi:condensation domain-containing protein [Krasilnikovia cinnamomea]|uniref:Condensation domain-containing protein n=1 Tax=Krasilnikovia cinnamomea TaxID=349313 RepID=A0A4V2G790_9ACTN|nr:condensation domain-containing protein [Krasilnikovia cinnamomea]RZU51656.1 condensation domain-containing protein [Krasilnikovia cinnamomea]